MRLPGQQRHNPHDHQRSQSRLKSPVPVPELNKKDFLVFIVLILMSTHIHSFIHFFKRLLLRGDQRKRTSDRCKFGRVGHQKGPKLDYHNIFPEYKWKSDSAAIFIMTLSAININVDKVYLLCNAVGVWDSSVDVVISIRYSNILDDVTCMQYVCRTATHDYSSVKRDT